MSILGRTMRAFTRVLGLGVVALSALTSGPGAIAAPPAPTEVNAQRMVHELAGLLAAGRTELFQNLARLGFGEQVAELNQPGVATIHTFSPQVAVEALYRRAELIEPGSGDRFLAVLYSDAAARSAAIASDPTFARLQAIARTMPAVRDAPIRFAPLSQLAAASVATPLPPALESVVGTLADFYSARGFAQARSSLLRNLQKPSFDRAAFDRILMAASSPENALRQMLSAGTPPPRAEIALRNLLREGMASSALLAIDAQSIRAIEELSRDLPPEYQRYAAQEGDIASRREQSAAATAPGQAGTVRKADDADVSRFFGRGPDDRAPPPDPAPWHPSPPDSGGGGGGGGGPGIPPAPPRQLAEHRKGYERYIESTFEGPTAKPAAPGATPRTSRSFEVARFSARAGRGVSVGAPVQVGQIGKPVKALWVTQRDDSRFGRLYVSLQVPGVDQPVLAASRVMFTDSFRSALASRWGSWEPSAQFREGEILVLMSMDPEHPISTASSRAARSRIVAAAMQGLAPDEQRQLRELEKKLSVAPTSARRSGRGASTAVAQDREAGQLILKGLSGLSEAQQQKVMDDAEALSATRGIVLHPSLVGRELAWTAARVDFWFNRPDALLAEVRKQNPGILTVSPVPALPQDMVTWQFYERSSTISLAPGTAAAREIVVTSAVGPESPTEPKVAQRSHFAVSIFSDEKAPGAIDAEDELYRRPDMERKVQPLLDWLATRHHDFMRLNDYSESLSMLRWLHRADVSPVIVDMSGDAKAIVTPDRVDIGKGPRAGAARR